MKNRLKALTILLALLSVLAAASVPMLTSTVFKQPNWVQLKPAQQKILAPLSQDWNQLPDARRKQLLATVNRYPKMTSVQQQRFSKRLLKWSRLPNEQRSVARARFKQFQHLAPHQREQIMQRWAEQHPPTNAQPVPGYSGISTRSHN